VDFSSLIQTLPLNQTTSLAIVVISLPFISFLLLIIFPNQRSSGQVAGLATALLGLDLLLASKLVWQTWNQLPQHSRFSWFKVSAPGMDLDFTAGIYIDNLSAMMLLVVVLISFLVHLFSIDYMRGDNSYRRYFSLLGLFTAVMLALVLSDNLFMIFIFWELVGFISYLLIGFWYTKDSATKAGTKAFLLNRLGDIGFLVGLLILWAQFSTLDLSAIQQLFKDSQLIDGHWLVHIQQNSETITHSLNAYWLTFAGLALFLGVMAKSAQFPFMAWLPDAMEGPTPVSALIHAATMVAAGVYLLARIFFLLDMESHLFIAVIGVLTAFMGAVGAFTQHDIKKVLAFSTISQLGFMVMGMGVGAYNAALFHLITHAFFKACLFLASGAVIHSMYDVVHNLRYDGHKIYINAQDMRYMGGLWRKMPVTFGAYLGSTLALAGVPFFSGFLSKDAILTGALSWAKVMASDGNMAYYLVPIVAFGAAMMTAMYMGRQVLLVFFGEFRLPKLDEQSRDAGKYLKDVSFNMKLPLIILTLMSFGSLYAINPFLNKEVWFLNAIGQAEILVPGINGSSFFLALEQAEEEVKLAVLVLTVILTILGFVWAFRKYHSSTQYSKNYLYRGDPENIWQRISHHNWYLDDVYEFFLKMNFGIARIFSRFDIYVVDGVFVALKKINRKIAIFAAHFDRKVINYFSDLFGVLHIVLAQVVLLFDRFVVDGIVLGTAWISGGIGQLSRSFQTGRVQTYVLWALIFLLVLIIFV